MENSNDFSKYDILDLARYLCKNSKNVSEFSKEIGYSAYYINRLVRENSTGFKFKNLTLLSVKDQKKISDLLKGDFEKKKEKIRLRRIQEIQESENFKRFLEMQKNESDGLLKNLEEVSKREMEQGSV